MEIVGTLLDERGGEIPDAGSRCDLVRFPGLGLEAGFVGVAQRSLVRADWDGGLEQKTRLFFVTGGHRTWAKYLFSFFGGSLISHHNGVFVFFPWRTRGEGLPE